MGTRLNPDGAKIRALRIQRGWTQEQLAEIAGISSRTIQRVETADCAAIETVRAVASAFETGFDQLLKTETRGGPEPEIVQPAPVPVYALKLDEPNSVYQSAHPVRHRLTTFQVAAAALAAGMLAGGIFTYRYDRRVGPRSSALQLNSMAPAQTGVWQKAPQARTAAGQASSLPRMVPRPVTGVATPDRKADVVADKPGEHASATQAGEIFQPAGLSPRTVVSSLPQPGYCDLPLQSRDLQVPVAFPEAPLTWSAHSALLGSLTQNDEGIGAVRHAMGQATKKTGEFVSRLGTSIKRAF